MTNKRFALVLLTFFLTACGPPPPPGEGVGEVPQGGMRANSAPPPTQTQPATVPPATPTRTAPSPTSPPPTEAPTEASPTGRTSPIDGMPQVYVPAGTVRMGGLDVYAVASDELPAHTVSLEAFWIDQLEIGRASCRER